ncbi:hypothetical protein LSTR_LSTR007561, partial [Laodelphax striatellus]
PLRAISTAAICISKSELKIYHRSGESFCLPLEIIWKFNGSVRVTCKSDRKLGGIENTRLACPEKERWRNTDKVNSKLIEATDWPTNFPFTYFKMGDPSSETVLKNFLNNMIRLHILMPPNISN